jgi:hypothetical protein
MYLTILKKKTTGEEREVNGTFSQEMLSFKTDYDKSVKVQVIVFSNISIYPLDITNVLFFSQTTVYQKLVLQRVFLSPDYLL